MKKYVAIMAILLCLGLCACGVVDSSDTVNSSLMDDSIAPTPATIYPLDYDSLNDLNSSISQRKANIIYEHFREEGVKNEQIDEIKLFVEKLQSQNITVPYLNGKVIEFRNKEGFANISFFGSEAYRLPWIFYYPTVSTGENFYIKITYIPDSIIDKQKKMTASEVIKELSPNSPNINNLGKQHESIYNQSIMLEDREVTALVIEYKNDNRNSTIFVYDDLLVEIKSNPEVWSTQWFATLSFDDFTE